MAMAEVWHCRHPSGPSLGSSWEKNGTGRLAVGDGVMTSGIKLLSRS